MYISSKNRFQAPFVWMSNSHCNEFYWRCRFCSVRELGVCTERDVESSPVFFPGWYIILNWTCLSDIPQDFFEIFTIIVVKKVNDKVVKEYASTKISQAVDDTTCFPCISFELFPLGVQNSAPKTCCPQPSHSEAAAQLISPHGSFCMAGMTPRDGLWIYLGEEDEQKLPLQLVILRIFAFYYIMIAIACLGGWGLYSGVNKSRYLGKYSVFR